MQTLSQKHMSIALECVVDVQQESSECTKIYVGLCKNFAVEVVQNGLMQAVMFHHAKSGTRSTARERAHAKLLDHVGKLLGVTDLVSSLTHSDALTYIGYSRTVVGSWGFFKNYARSVLGGE